MRLYLKLFTMVFFLSPFITVLGVNAAGAKDTPAKKARMEAAIKVDPSKNTLDVYIKDIKTGNPVTGASVKATVISPGGKRVMKELSGMKMGDGYSYMGSIDAAEKGLYVIDVSVERGRDKAWFNFKYER